MTLRDASQPGIRFMVQPCDDAFQHELGFSFHAREEHLSPDRVWVPSTVHGHFFDRTGAQAAAEHLNRSAGWPPGSAKVA